MNTDSLLAMPLTTTKPTRPGRYCYEMPGTARRVRVTVYVECVHRPEGELWAEFEESGHVKPVDRMTGRWAGPYGGGPESDHTAPGYGELGDPVG